MSFTYPPYPPAPKPFGDTIDIALLPQNCQVVHEVELGSSQWNDHSQLIHAPASPIQPRRIKAVENPKPRASFSTWISLLSFLKMLIYLPAHVCGVPSFLTEDLPLSRFHPGKRWTQCIT